MKNPYYAELLNIVYVPDDGVVAAEFRIEQNEKLMTTIQFTVGIRKTMQETEIACWNALAEAMGSVATAARKRIENLKKHS
ncbi:MAG: hypothetical protein RIB41_09995 [Oceanibaculum nanhaiense]|jgi:hypothetical protein|uniref:hypothetical protein n=1 Tax=Oceanibaculum nanhaiense TaxID=1909734 RepID=UPI0032F03534